MVVVVVYKITLLTEEHMSQIGISMNSSGTSTKRIQTWDNSITGLAAGPPPYLKKYKAVIFAVISFTIDYIFLAFISLTKHLQRFSKCSHSWPVYKCLLTLNGPVPTATMSESVALATLTDFAEEGFPVSSTCYRKRFGFLKLQSENPVRVQMIYLAPIYIANL